jgi:hypothetical protein
MATKPPKPAREFGTRRPSVPVAPQPSPPAKRSGHVALLLMGTFAVGTAAYALTPRNSCESSPNVAQPSLLQSNANCPPRGSSSGGGSGGGRSYYSGGSSSSQSASGTSDSGSSHVTRGGFGSFAHAFGFSGG